MFISTVVYLIFTPSQDSFPLYAQEDVQPSWFWRLFGASGSTNNKHEDKTTRMTVPKYAEPDSLTPQLSIALQYGQASGLVMLQKFLLDFSKRVYSPAYDDFEVLCDTGSTDGFVSFFCLFFDLS
jgi:aromatic amino acid aminotransferase I / 2-aminoadipate transaminase